MFLWQDKLSCNGSFKLVCQVGGSGSIILIRHLHIPLLCQEQASLYVLDMSTCISRLIEWHRVTGAAWDPPCDNSESMCTPHWSQLGSRQTKCIVLAVPGLTGIYLQVVFQLGLGATCP